MDVGVCTYIERKKKKRRNNNKLNRVWTTTVSQVSWIFAMNSKLNRSSLYYWQRDMLIVLIICAVFAEPHRWTILKLCNWGLKIIYDLRALARYLKIRRHEFSANRWQSMKFATTSVWLSIDHRLADANRCQLTIINRLSSIDRLVFRSSIFIDCSGPAEILGLDWLLERFMNNKVNILNKGLELSWEIKLCWN